MKKKGISLNIESKDESETVQPFQVDLATLQEPNVPVVAKKSKKPQLVISNEEENDKSEVNPFDKYLAKFQEPERLCIHNKTDTLIQSLVKYMEGENDGMDLSYSW